MTLLGTFIGVPGGSTTGAYNSFENAVGQNATSLTAYVNDYTQESGWANDAQYTANQFASTSWSQNVIPVVDIPMASVGEDADSSFHNIMNGSEDGDFNGIFQAWANAGYKTFYIDPGWEFNGNWMPWSITSGNAGDFVSAFQHIAALAHSFGGANIQVVWTPNVGGHGAVPVSQLYPGNSSVDVVGLDSYGQPINVDDSPNDTSTDPNDWTLTDALNLAKANGKQFGLPETGGTDTAFPANLASVIANSGVQTAFINIWDTPDANHDLTWSNDPNVSAAWRQAYAEIASNGGGVGVPATTATPTATPTPTPTATPAPTTTADSTTTADPTTTAAATTTAADPATTTAAAADPTTTVTAAATTDTTTAADPATTAAAADPTTTVTAAATTDPTTAADPATTAAAADPTTTVTAAATTDPTTAADPATTAAAADPTSTVTAAATTDPTTAADPATTAAAADPTTTVTAAATTDPTTAAVPAATTSVAADPTATTMAAAATDPTTTTTPDPNPAATTTSYSSSDAILTTAPTTGGFPVVGILASGALDQIGISQIVSNGVDTITADNLVWGEWAQIVGNNVDLSFVNAGNLTVAGDAGNAVVSVASGNDTFLVGTGSMDITGGSGANDYVFNGGGGSINVGGYMLTGDSGSLKVEDFKPGTDILTVSKNLEGAYQSASDGNGGTLLTFGTSGSIDLVNQTGPTAAQIHWT